VQPILFQIGNFSVYSYGAMISLAILIAAVALFREAQREKVNPDHVLEAIIVSALAGLIGSRLLYVALNWHQFSGRWSSILFARFEGLSFYGAFAGGVLAMVFWCRWRKVSFLKLTDLLAPYLALGYAFGRIGCFLNGCCYGKVSDAAWAIAIPAVDSLPRHPAQLYAAFGALLIFAILKLARRYRPFAGFNLITLAALYGTLRFIMEFFRIEPAVWLGLTAAQLFSLGLTVTSLVLLILVFSKGSGKSGKASTR
jgi:phosphatidylglycerol---prolipoprotein diacylglyceryl transferase